MLSASYCWKPRRKWPIGILFSNIIVLTWDDIIFSAYYMKLLYRELRSGKYTLFELRLFCYLAPLKHCAEAIQLSEELSKVLKQLPCTFSSHRTRSRLRRLWSKFKGALLTILLFEELAIRAGGLRIDVLMLHYVCSCCEEPFGVDFVEIGSSVN